MAIYACCAFIYSRLEDSGGGGDGARAGDSALEGDGARVRDGVLEIKVVASWRI